MLPAFPAFPARAALRLLLPTLALCCLLPNAHASQRVRDSLLLFDRNLTSRIEQMRAIHAELENLYLTHYQPSAMDQVGEITATLDDFSRAILTCEYLRDLAGATMMAIEWRHEAMKERLYERFQKKRKTLRHLTVLTGHYVTMYEQTSQVAIADICRDFLLRLQDFAAIMDRDAGPDAESAPPASGTTAP